MTLDNQPLPPGIAVGDADAAAARVLSVDLRALRLTEFPVPLAVDAPASLKVPTLRVDFTSWDHMT